MSPEEKKAERARIIEEGAIRFYYECVEQTDAAKERAFIATRERLDAERELAASKKK